MGRPRKTESQRRAERFDELYRTGKSRMKLKETDIAAMIGVNRDTLRRFRQDPAKRFSAQDLDIIATALRWSDEEYLSVARAGRA